jgi:hypothetical protein
MTPIESNLKVLTLRKGKLKEQSNIYNTICETKTVRRVPLIFWYFPKDVTNRTPKNSARK